MVLVQTCALVITGDGRSGVADETVIGTGFGGKAFGRVLTTRAFEAIFTETLERVGRNSTRVCICSNTTNRVAFGDIASSSRKVCIITGTELGCIVTGVACTAVIRGSFAERVGDEGFRRGVGDFDMIIV